MSRKRCSLVQDWTEIHNAAEPEDTDIWTVHTPTHLDASLWPFVLLTLLWRIWDVRNGEIFRSKPSSTRCVLTLACDDLVIWQKRLRTDLDVSHLR
jgi:hypothetical protein